MNDDSQPAPAQRPEAAPHPGGQPTSTRACWIAAGLAFLLVFALTYRPASIVFLRLLPPDALEYASTAQRLATHGEYSIPIGDRREPSRYPPSFSLLLAPAYVLAPDNFTAGIWICRALWAGGCAAFVFAVARRFNVPSALFVIALLHLHPLVLSHASDLLSDSPSVAALLAMVAVGSLAAAPRLRDVVLVGVALAVGVACRSTALCFALPFLPIVWRHPRRALAAAALLGPAAGVLAGNALYNRWQFGSFAMNGYLYWCPMPYSRLDYVFHPSYFALQWELLSFTPAFWIPLLLGIIAAIAVRFLDPPAWRGLVRPLLVAVTPVTLLFLVYFTVTSRFYLPAIIATTLFFGIAIASLLRRFAAGPVVAGVLAASCVGTGFYLVSDLYLSTDKHPLRRPLHDRLFGQMRERLPDRCQLITRLDPIIIEAQVTRGTARRWIAATRTQEYADKVLADRPIDLAGIPRPPPLNHLDPRLLERGARLAVPLTAEDDVLLDRLAAPGAAPTYVDQPTLHGLPGLRHRLNERFVLRPVPGAPLLVECVRRASASP